MIFKLYILENIKKLCSPFSVEDTSFNRFLKSLLLYNLRVIKVWILFCCRNVCLLGMEAIYKDNKVVGYVRRADYAFYLDKPIAYGWVKLCLWKDYALSTNKSTSDLHLEYWIGTGLNMYAWLFLVHKIFHVVIDIENYTRQNIRIM